MRARMRGQKTGYHHGDLKQGLMEAAATLIDNYETNSPCIPSIRTIVSVMKPLKPVCIPME